MCKIHAILPSKRLIQTRSNCQFPNITLTGTAIHYKLIQKKNTYPQFGPRSAEEELRRPPKYFCPWRTKPSGEEIPELLMEQSSAQGEHTAAQGPQV